MDVGVVERRVHLVEDAERARPEVEDREQQGQAGERVQVTLKMQLEFEGKFTVKALNPTTMATYGSLELHTDYTV